MRSLGTACFGIARLFAITASLLFAVSAASASSSLTTASTPSVQGIGCDRYVSFLPDTLNHHGAAEHQSLHCHLHSPHPQEPGLILSVVDDDLPLLTSNKIFTPARQAEEQSPAHSSRDPIAGLPRFILFGNFRS